MKRNVVQVVEFEDPFAKRRRLHGDPVPGRHSSTTSTEQQQQSGGEHKKEYQKIRNEVQQLGQSGASKKEKKQLQEQYLVSLGCKPEKKEKIPMKIFASMKKTHAKRAAKKEAEERRNELVTVKKASTKTKSGGERKRTFDLLSNLSTGRERNGVVYVQPPSARTKY